MPWFLLAFLVLLLSACSQHSVRINQPELLKKKTDPICAYRHIKGIAELIEIGDRHYQFMFYPNNIKFEVSQKSINSNLHAGTELKATYQQLLKGPASCLKYLPIILTHHIKSSGI